MNDPRFVIVHRSPYWEVVQYRSSTEYPYYEPIARCDEYDHAVLIVAGLNDAAEVPLYESTVRNYERTVLNKDAQINALETDLKHAWTMLNGCLNKGADHDV